MEQINAAIPLGVQPIKLESGANQLAMMSEAAKIREINQLGEDRNALRGLDPNSPDYLNRVSQINPKLGMEMGANQSLMKKQGVETEAAQYKLGRDKTNNAIREIANLDSPDQAIAGITSKMKSGEIKPDQGQAMIQGIQTKPFKQWKSSTIDGLLNAHEYATLAEQKQNNSITQGIASYNATKPTFVPEYGGYVSPPNKTNPTGGFVQVKDAQGNPLQSNKELDPQENAALTQAITEGRVDPNAVNSRNKKIIAATLMATPGVNLVGLHGDVVNTNASARTTGTQQGKVTSAANEAGTMLGLVKVYSDAVDRTQYPSLNAVQNAVSKGTGDENIIRFNTAINSAVNAYARAINPNGVATVADKNHARELLTNAYSKGQINAALEVMQQEVNAAKASPSAAHKQLNPGGAGNKSNAPASAISAPPGYVID